VDRAEFERAILQWWAKTRIPLTLANVALLSNVPRKKCTAWLDAMTGEGVLDVDADDEGNLVYSVRGAPRSSFGPASYDEYDRLQQISAPVARGPGSNAIATYGAPAFKEKNVALAALLPFFLGPIGLLYAAPIAEAILVMIVWAAAFAILAPFLGGAIHLGVAGLGLWYALAHNQKGRRVSLFESKNKPRALPPR
jgi:hypothetical protein